MVLRLNISRVRRRIISRLLLLLLLLLLLHNLRIVLWLKRWSWKSSCGNSLRHHSRLGLTVMYSRLWCLIEVSSGWRRSTVVVWLLRNHVLVRIRRHSCHDWCLIGHAFWSRRLFRGRASISILLMSATLVFGQSGLPAETSVARRLRANVGTSAGVYTTMAGQTR